MSSDAPNILRRLLELGVPRNIDDPRELRAWRQLSGIATLAIVAHLLAAASYLAIGAFSGAMVLLAMALFLGLLDIVGVRTRNIKITFVLGSSAMMTTLTLLSLSKGHFALSTFMWFVFLPIGSLAGLGPRWMLVSIALGLGFGATGFLLPHYGIQLDLFPMNPNKQQVLDFTTWVFFILTGLGIMLNILNAYRRSETEREALHLVIEKSRRMQAIGELAGGVAHEFNNLLTVIRGTAAMMRDDATDSVALENLGDIERAAERGGDIARELLLFSRGASEDQSGVCDASESLHACIRLIGPILGSHIEIITDVQSSLPHIAVKPRVLEQTIVNLALNARDAMNSAGGELHIAARVERVEPDLARRLDIEQGRWLAIEVRDTGIGMDEETLARIYEPFFTTKATGTGLGLAVVFGLVRRVGGGLHIDSTLGEGTSFQMYLPIADAPRQAKTRVPSRDHKADAKYRVMLVEDQDTVRKMASRVLTRAGYQVSEACDGKAALALLASSECPDIVVSDVRMPRMGGAQLAQRLRSTHPELPVIFMTGFAGTEEDDAALDELGLRVLRKPFAPDDLLVAVRNTLSERAARRASL